MHGATEAVPVRFTGDAREYFGIWIVNVLLSIVTLGIYSAWAKVRTRKYFLGNTAIDGRPFDYHATGRQILIGRAIVVAGFAFLYGANWLVPSPASAALGGLFLTALLVNRGLRFNASVTSWSNVRFRFEEDDQRAFLIFGIYPFLAALALFLAFPFVARATKRYTVGGTPWANIAFPSTAGSGRSIGPSSCRRHGWSLSRCCLSPS